MRKFLFSPALWTSLFGAIGVIKTSRNGPRDWRLILNWVVTAAGVFGGVTERFLDSRGATRAVAAFRKGIGIALILGGLYFLYSMR